MRLGDSDLTKAESLVKSAREIHFQNLEPNRNAPLFRLIDKSPDYFSTDASVLVRWDNLDVLQKNEVGLPVDLEHTYGAAVGFNDLPGARIEEFKKPVMLPLLIPPPGPVNILAQRFPMQRPEKIPVFQSCGTKCNGHLTLTLIS